MSLTRAEWEEMWHTVYKIQIEANHIRDMGRRKRILVEVDKIKAQIQSVIGQME